MSAKSYYFIPDLLLKPVTIATESIMTNKPKAIPNTANETIDSENFREVPLVKNIRRAMNSSVLNSDTSFSFA